jgi:uncharacterized protein YceK
MKKNLLLFLVLAPLLTGCATMMYGDKVNHGTTVFYPDGTVMWAPDLEYDGDGSTRASNEADSIARREATYQTTKQYAVWKFAGYDYEFNKMELSSAIAKGTHRLGEQINNLRVQPGRIGNVHAGSSTEAPRVLSESTPAKIVLIDPSKPGTYCAVEVKTIENRTVNALDDATYQRVFKQNYQQLYERYNQEYTAKREHAFAYIKEKMQGDLADLPDDMVISAAGGKLTGKDLKSMLQRRLTELPAGSVLVAGGAHDDLVLVASINNGVFECKMAK